MHLKELILEGFKSYAQKTVVKPFDKHFNAITGLNGSGKSNILDSLIFLLGITGYRDLRASDSKDLIYKQGSAGITTATVTGVFDNSDPNRSPNGYQHCKSITVSRSILATGQSKYTINNIKCTQTQVQEMFQSVQLNVLNPHFIIMQGRILKVCNMKPVELLRLIEEATGTAMYENKRDTALKNMGQREAMLKQAEEMMDHISQKRNDLNQKVKKYQEFRSLAPLIDSLKRQLAAINYVEFKRDLDKSKGDKERYEGEIRNAQVSVEKLNDELENFKNTEKEILDRISTSTRSQEAKNNFDRCKQAESEARGLLDEFTLEKKEMEVKKRKVDEKINKTEEQADKFQAQIDTKTKLLLESQGKENDLKEYVETLSSSYHDFGNSTNALSNFQEKKRQEEMNISQFETGIHLSQTNIQSHRDIINEEEQRLQNDRNQHAIIQKEIESLQHDHQSAEDRVTISARELRTKLQLALSNQSPDSFTPDQLDQQRDLTLPDAISIFRSQQSQLRNLIQQQMEEGHRLRNRAGNPLNNNSQWFGVTRNLGFFATLNKNNIDPRRLYGIVVDLIKVENVDQWGLAVEVASGPKLFNVVTDSYEIGTQLLRQNQGANSSINILPLDRLNFNINQQRLNDIRNRFGNDRVMLASEVVLPRANAPPAFERALQQIFGSVFFCSDAMVARDVAGMGCRAITAKGDAYEPGGVISGGSINGMNWLREYVTATDLGSEGDRIIQKARLYEQLDGQINECLNQTMSLTRQQHDITARQERLKRSGYQRGIDHIDTIKKEIEKELATIESYKERIKKSKEIIKEYAEIVKSMNNGGGDSERRKAEMKKELEIKRNELKALMVFCERLKGEVEDIQETKKDHDDTHSSLKDEQQALFDRLGELETLISTAVLTVAERNEDSNRAANIMSRFNKENEEEQRKLQNLKQEIQQNESSIKSYQSQIANYKGQIKELDTTITHTQQLIQQSLKANPWIKNDESRFNVPNTEYDFTDKTTQSIHEQLERETAKLTTLKKYNDPLCIEQLDQLERDFKDKMVKLNGVKVDRDAIKKSISMLDLKKTETVENTYKVVDRYFGQIFSILLPGAHSRLKPHRAAPVAGSNNDQGALVGCEMQVAFNGKWKESLSELSGGQRSLLALSLILALLRCKPAPLYILDEVDAALDASHTQNIGKTIKEHFEQSQFVIVSLKEGMFENANVLVRTQLGPNGSQISVSRRGGTGE